MLNLQQLNYKNIYMAGVWGGGWGMHPCFLLHLFKQKAMELNIHRKKNTGSFTNSKEKKPSGMTVTKDEL